ncbi:AAA family ATPase, partial [Algiphilus sp.]|uniref:AAA family ATPase n=1 Tax=Algiphilus sp. TaxID=1872431 RepID=UPI003C5919C3
MMSALEPDALYRRCDPASLGFSTTNELEPLEHPAGQDRALEALEFGTGIAEPGYNIFVLGPRAAGKHTLVRRVLETRAADRSVPPDQCYIHNFERPGEPRLLTLPAGRGRQLQEDLEGLIEELFDTVPATFESEEYQGRLQDIQRSAQQQQEHAFQEVRDRAQEQEIALLQTPGGFTFAPMADGEVMDPEAFQKLDEATRERWQKKVESLQEELAKALRKIPQWRKEFGQRVRALNREMAEMTVGASLREIEDRYADCRAVGTHLAAIKHDITNNVDAFRSRDARDAQTDDNQASRPEAVHAVLNRYRVNVIVDNRDRSGAPVIYADLPGYQHLVGRAEHLARQGALFTDFTLLRAGALHQANGGYLILDARKLLMQPWAWEALKRALTAAEVRIESLERSLSLISTVSLEPEPMPLDLKVILIGDRELYYLLSAHDPDFNSLFKVQADFEDDLPRDETTARTYARL